MNGALEKKWIDLYLANADIIAEGLPPVINRARAEALEVFNLSGFPDKGSGNGDRYHYTGLRGLYDRDFEYYFMPSYRSVTLPPARDGHYSVSFLNGFCTDTQTLTRLENGAVFGSLAAAAREVPELVEEAYNRLAGKENDAMTAFNSKDGGFFLTTVGRVQTPTLAIVMEREEKINAFVSRPYWEVHAKVQCEAGQYDAVWFDPVFKKNEEDPHQKAERIWSKEDAQRICKLIEGQTASVKQSAKRTTQLSPLLFDLTSLQREANNRFGFSAKTTLALAQALYEKHKALTYPRTDARALPEDYLGTVNNTLDMLKESSRYMKSVGEIQKHKWVKPSKRIFDNSKISDHFAIIPTLQAPKKLTEAEEKIYDLVVKRFLAVFFPAAEYDVTTRITTVADQNLKTEGKVLVKAGWLEVYGRGTEEAETLVPVKDNEKVTVKESLVE